MFFSIDLHCFGCLKESSELLSGSLSEMKRMLLCHILMALVVFVHVKSYIDMRFTKNVLFGIQREQLFIKQCDVYQTV